MGRGTARVFELRALSVMVVGALPAAAATTYTWTGADGALTAPDTTWGDKNNWAGGVAPAKGETVDLVFPVLTCAACLTSTNNLDNVTVESLTIHEAPSADLSVSVVGYDISGTAVVLNGLSVSSNGSTLSLVTADLRMPITLGGNATWTVSNGGYISIVGAVTGSNDLAVTLSGRSTLGIGGAVNVGAVTVSGAGSSINNVQGNGEFAVNKFGSLNAGSGNPVAVTQVGIFGAGSFGPLTTSDTVFQTGDGGTSPGITSVTGSVVLDASTILSFVDLNTPAGVTPVPGTDNPELTATGNIALNSAWGVWLPPDSDPIRENVS